jgi:ADP-heptose:LPS heptosyltransferase/GT2 family glycosyltransferase/glycosyltransferase involved in cell wall biosynthesis
VTHCILQWARLGDLFQTRPLLARIRAKDPGANIVLCVDEMLLELASSFPEPDRVAGIPLRRFWALANAEHHLDTLFAEFEEFLEKANFQQTDIVYILNRSHAANQFARMLRAKEMRGFLGRNGIPDAPMAYLNTMVSDPAATPAHLADLWALLAGAPDATPDFPLALREHFPASLPISQRRLGIFVGAGDASRVWPVECWMEWLSLLKDEIQEVLLLGTEHDSTAAQHIEDSCHKLSLPVRNVVGRTTPAVLGSYLTSCNLIVGSDSGGIHFAAALGIPVLGLFFSGARAAFTGPYASCARVLESEIYAPGHQIPSPKDAARVARMMFTGQDESSQALTSAFTLRAPRLDNCGLLYQSSTEKCEVPLQQRKPLWQKLAEPYPEVPTPKNNRPRVSVIIPAAGQAHLTRECLREIAGECRELSGEILVVTGDKISTDHALGNEFSDVRIIVAERQRSFSELCNLGARESSGKFLLLLNNDTLPERGWLRSLLDTYNAQAPCVLSPLLLYWDGLVQNGGVRLREDRIEELEHGSWPERRCDVVECDAVSAVAMLVSRELFESLGGFDERYVNGYEDLDLCLRAREKGVHSIVDYGARVRHFRGATSGRYDYEEQNRARFEQRWMAQRIQVGEGQSEPVVSLSHSSHNNPSMQVCVICAEDWKTAGSRVRWAGPLIRLEKEGLLRARWYCTTRNPQVWEELKAALPSSSLVILRRPLHDASQHERLLELLSRLKIPFLVDADDLFLERFPRHSARGQARRALEETFCALLEQAQMMTVSTAPLADAYKKYHNEVAVLPNTADPLWWPEKRSREAASGEIRIGFFGSPVHGLDLASVAPALEEFLNEESGQTRLFVWGAFPKVLREYPEIRQGGPFVRDYQVHLERLAQHPVDFAVVPLLDSPVNRCRSLIRFLELGWYGIPAIYSNVGEYADCLKNGQDGLLVGETTEDWLEALRKLRHDAQLRESIAHHARTTVEKFWTLDKHIQKYRDVLSRLGIKTGSTSRHPVTLPRATSIEYADA